MSVFDTEFADKATPALVARFGQAVTYHPANASDISTAGILTEESENETPGGGGLTGNRRAQLQVQTADVATRTNQDQVTVDATSEKWEVESLGPASGGLAVLIITRIGRAEATRPEYRGAI